MEQADLKDVTVSEDQDKNTITLGGTLHSDDAKARAADVAKVAANTRIIANEIVAGRVLSLKPRPLLQTWMRGSKKTTEQR